MTPTESIFTSVLGKYRKVVGLSEFELKDVTDYFQIRDGRVAYRQFCKTVCSEGECTLVPRLAWLTLSFYSSEQDCR